MHLLHSFRFLAQLLFSLPPFCFLSCPLFLIFLPLFFFLTPVVFIPSAFLLWIRLLPSAWSLLRSELGQHFGCKSVIYLLWAKWLNSCLNKKQLLQNVLCWFFVHTEMTERSLVRRVGNFLYHFIICILTSMQDIWCFHQKGSAYAAFWTTANGLFFNLIGTACLIVAW